MWYTRWPKPGIFSLRASLRAHDLLGLLEPARPRRSRAAAASRRRWRRRAAAPSARRSPPTIAEWMSVSVAAATRAANVDAFSSWSACRMSATSNARVASAARPLAGQHVEEVRRVAQHRIRLRSARRRRSAGPSVATSDADLRRQPDGLAVVRLRRVVGGVRIVVAERRGQRPQRVHAVARRQRRASAGGSARAARAPRPAATADRRARRASAAAGATAGSRPPRTSRAAPGRGCRSRSRRARRDRRRDSRWPTRWRRCLRAPPWASRPWS